MSFLLFWITRKPWKAEVVFIEPDIFADGGVTRIVTGSSLQECLVKLRRIPNLGSATVTLVFPDGTRRPFSNDL